jgi:hypothetical protein
VHILGTVLFAVAGIALLNGMPHFVAGSAGQVFRTPFGRYSSAQTNVAWGLGNVALGVVLVFVRLALGDPQLVDMVWFIAGALAVVAYFGFRARRFVDDRQPPPQ